MAQADKIKQLAPKAFLIEMVANALDVNDGLEVEAVIDSLSGLYHVHTSVLKVAHFGDCSNRERLFIVGFERDTAGDIGRDFKFPNGDFNSLAPITAQDIAVDDEDVPERFWMQEDIAPFCCYEFITSALLHS